MSNDMSTEDEEKVEFLKNALNYLEARINLVDNKASILMAIQGGFFMIITYVIKELFLTDTPSIINSVSYISLTLDLFFATVTILLFAWTIRPSKKLFGLDVDLDKMNIKGYVMWFEGGFPGSEEVYKKRIESLDTSEIKGNYENAHFSALQLIEKKYNYYRWAARIMKITILLSAIGLSVLGLLKLGCALPFC